ncbi:MAG TPA: ATP-binding protein, partial [Herpetosiphonaceae bacterium]|nr:ATP-binding protein [Herpetosiphonaceae bacterium]
MLTDAEIMAAVLAAFQEEQAEHCQGIAGLLLELEQNPDSPERKDLIDRLFREAHSLKGGARAAGQFEVERIAHGMEDLFSAVRQGQLELTPAVCDPIYAALEAIGAIMARVAASEPASAAAYAAVLVNLAGALAAPAGPANDGAHRVALAEAGRPAFPPAWEADGEAGAARAGDQHAHAGRLDALSVRIPVAALDTLLNETGELMAYAVRARQRTRQAEDLADIPGRWRRIARQVRPIATRLRALEETIQPTVHYLEGRQGFAAAAGRSNGKAGVDDRDVSALAEAVLHADALIGDLERRLTAYIRDAGEDQSRLATVTDRLHDQIRRTRMLPLTTLLNPLRLQVRDMARAAGKPVHVLADDGAAEADRQVLEALREIVLHLLRNAVDHGIEAQAVRLAQDKPAEGRIAVFSRVSGDRLSLVIEDDGAGIDLAAIRQRALGMGLHSEADLAAMGEAEVLDLIFLPGFSTSATVNSLSGRGVGLDIVRTRLQRIQGHITIHSVPGRGARFALSVPLSLTSAQSLLLQAGPDQYVVPLDAVQHILAVQPADLFVVEGQATITYQGRPTLIVRLADVLAGQATRPGAGSAQLG